jgi:large repetitive protein
VYVDVNGFKDTAVVHITKVSSIVLTPNPVILQPGQTQQMKATAKDNYDNIIPLTASEYEWSTTGGVGTINSTGNFTAVNQGNGFITAAYDSITGSVPVEIGASTYVVVEDYTTITGYTLGGTSINLAQCSFTRDTNIFVSEPSSGKLHYVLVTGGTSTLDVKKDIPISGTPDKVGINVYGDGRGHWLRGEFKDVDNERFLIDFTTATPGIDWTNEWRYIEKLFSSAVPSWANPNAVLTFPVTWMRIYLAEP